MTSSPNSSATICTEIAVFTLKTGQEEAFFKCRPDLTGFLGRQPGFLDLQTLRSDKNLLTFIDIVQWSDSESAQKAAALFEKSPEAAKLMGLVEEVCLFEHFSSLKN